MAAAFKVEGIGLIGEIIFINNLNVSLDISFQGRFIISREGNEEWL